MSANPSEDPEESTLTSRELALLHRLDEKTERIDRRLEEVTTQVGDNSDDIDTLQSRVRRNTTIIGGVTTGITAVAMWGYEAILNLFP